MKTNRLSETIFRALNTQMTKEAQAAQVYLALGAWADDKGYEGISKFLFRHANEERNHMTKILEYILDRGAKPVIEAIPAPGIPDPTTVQQCFNSVFEQEVDNTTSIYKVVQLSLDEQDWATWNFMQWFVKEQVEEETLSLKLLDKIKIAGGEKATDEALQTLDQELEHTPGDVPPATAATQANP